MVGQNRYAFVGDVSARVSAGRQVMRSQGEGGFEHGGVVRRHSDRIIAHRVEKNSDMAAANVRRAQSFFRSFPICSSQIAFTSCCSASVRSPSQTSASSVILKCSE